MSWSPETPFLAVDILIELVDRPGRPVVLIERVNPPHGWAIPGGFVDRGERAEQAAVREAQEETCLDVTLTGLLGVYSDPKRDARLHTCSLVYMAEATGQPRAADDAKNVRLVDPAAPGVALAFDHGLILRDLVAYRKQGRLAPLRMDESD
ncbi:NUDIX hydrolase [Magnetococcus marinus MC-1]|uniref:NUDIX hydrolase n=1 Tax=Magnetococcus marinus (strain ATCC BAA-1437 / JCM 17883 / MC-1) TaxID=156889 RepID=A0L511_MAGMM|nr:NUDIX hydrolase [Magnetococcus marinus]ABK43054.1 NUDIX hydrolase [Magnetococcus marinus MC-1]